MNVKRVLRRAATLVIGLVYLLEAAAATFNLATKPPSAELWWVLAPAPLVLLFSGIWVLRGVLWPALIPIAYVAFLVIYILVTAPASFTLPYPITS
jgi:hypothetical protein